ncbi:hypothetical protein [Bradyrhizobium sp. CCGB20]|uniref:hypothetical protein n=1 Tax=Bradyrhizobium sp. CCGB20 TaxID=2949633 RepID=UPI0020B1C387|nr:hypothetical protein [Bradyrhizobium sp. CCGB20]MCP3397630.1 hypothetical protein [Bradyrhizobium sp. CCGB20]
MTSVQLFDLTEAGILFELKIEIDPDGTTLSSESSYGVYGRIKAKGIVISFEPKPASSSRTWRAMPPEQAALLGPNRPWTRPENRCKKAS